ncbi:MAG: transporter substrate-binding domain-containing protein [Acidimicrobiia bacterium]
MKKTLIALLSISILLYTVGCSSKEKSADSLNLVESGKLTVCSDIPYAPFEFLDGSKVVGIDADILRAIAKKLDLEANFVDTDFDAIFAALKSGKCDVIASSVTINDERKKANNFSDPYYTISQSILVAKDNESKLTDLDKLNGKVVGVQSETTGEAFAKDNASKNGYTVKSFTGADEMVAALKSGQIDAVIQDYPINAYDAKTSGKTVVTKQFDGNENYGIVIPKDSTDLLKKINTALSDIKESGDYDKIVNTYLKS